MTFPIIETKHDKVGDGWHYQMSITLSGSRHLSCPVFLYQ